jgi:hypothetical protein
VRLASPVAVALPAGVASAPASATSCTTAIAAWMATGAARDAAANTMVRRRIVRLGR